MSGDNADQQTFWTDQAGPTWVAQMAAMDDQLAPVLAQLLQRANLRAGEDVIDIGCGAGTSTLQAMHQVGPTGTVLGADISATLLDVARARAKTFGNVGFLHADAQTHAFEPAGFDCLISRFGVMFFEDPTAAFANMAKALRPDGRMVFATWGAIPENPYFTLPAKVAKDVIGAVPKTDPDGPGPFAFRDPNRVASLLSAAGLADIEPQEVTLALTPSGDAASVAALMCEIGPAERALSHFEVAPAGRARLVHALTDALAPLQTPDGIRIPARINFFTARKPA
ncbi:class I SAM-dependent methyltransferase [Sulfitobacter geojensis]|uniref:Methyltransferase domain-containing protein n=1 Tax=Sulfitobacter geojensis TaxID=1342299 RepID=A0AAE2VVZ3_9RHOB|nr:class I SAM-dependent methyltransferase [Sulfitobacter geojensis]MBM1688149.1 methyltransferase domain-containing protein [Sulfitobacter geojensis]MBM1692216.1 methyltransferase domain-containing protein [Sulfitobacter geojensis]MBM1704382.1 methyltransferase domain-containing protein [Sulfitobacter geojensis]MBM1708440.1 methyltransferase domain-containing protein [Sulfitobacter geojensis]MBM1712505.1 methyltransferase domain-containing protein [Sulfitobacter geojensis]